MRSFSYLGASFALTAPLAYWFIWGQNYPDSGVLVEGLREQYGTQDRTKLESTAVVFDWGEITPTKELVWHPCYNGFQCARLEVPLNYSEPEGRTAAIAITRKQALVPPTSRFYKGPILLNPGGPGGSGVMFALLYGAAISTIVGPQFDIVGFDPRGIAYSTPGPAFFADDVERTAFFSVADVLNTTSEGVARMWARAQIIGQLAESNDDGFLVHINTPNTARDMLTITEAYGWEKLQYWGFSYGTVLGATFASMFPDKVGRLALDGVMDAEDYYATGWTTNLEDTDKVINQFYEGCSRAGPGKCAFHAPEPADIKRNLTRLFDDIRKRPVPVVTEYSYGLVDYARIRALVFSSLYSPYHVFSRIAQALADLAKGDGSTVFSLYPNLVPSCNCDAPGSPSLLPGGAMDSQVTLICNDGQRVSDKLPEADRRFKNMGNVSEWADVWGRIPLGCVGWPTPGPSFKGPFEGNTSNPILFIGNTADPVTPLSSAKKMSEGFKGSVVLTQDSLGHCSLAALSPCTFMHVRRYFNSGTLPKPGTVCKVMGSPFFAPLLQPTNTNLQTDGGQEPLALVGQQEEAVDEDFGEEFLAAVAKLTSEYPIHALGRSIDPLFA